MLSCHHDVRLHIQHLPYRARTDCSCTCCCFHYLATVAFCHVAWRCFNLRGRPHTFGIPTCSSSAWLCVPAAILCCSVVSTAQDHSYSRLAASLRLDQLETLQGCCGVVWWLMSYALWCGEVAQVGRCHLLVCQSLCVNACRLSFVSECPSLSASTAFRTALAASWS